MPEFSIVIPLYNKGRHIARALNSVLAQSVQDYEIIVIDDGSTDDGAEVVKGFSDNRIHLIRQANAGVSAARNKGIDSAGASLIAFLDADDYWKPDYLRTIKRLHDCYSDAGLYATAYEVTMRGGMIFVPRFNGIPKAPWEGIITDYFKAALGNPPLSTSATVVKKVVFEKVGVFSSSVTRGEDADMWARIAFDYPLAFSNSLSTVYCLDADNRACSTPNTERDPVILQTMRKALQSMNMPSERRYYMKEYMHLEMLALARAFAEMNDLPVARSILAECRTKYFLKKKLLLLIFCFLPKTVRRGLIVLNKLLREIVLYRLAYYFLWRGRRERALNV
jgi:glycosyltransferase involved in cell wall biosynthesis